ncbi:MAG: fumarylacetoacetate hydrolase family protein [Ahrensia sp.]|nr:fumarylacetoacetate hydrolase family protein [Ahrensia sp.]
MPYVFSAHPQAAVSVFDTADRFPIRRIFCVGRNYADHVVEMGGDPDREQPFFFTKPADTVWQGEGEMPFAPRTGDLHHEAELVVAIGRAGANVDASQALDMVFGYAAGVDLTRRDLQAEAKKRGRPWDMSKGFDHSAPMSAVMPASLIGHPDAGRLHLTVNGETRQDGDLAQQVWKVPEIVAELSTYVALAPGDLIMTGTPAGVGPLFPGDHVVSSIEGIGEIAFTMGAKTDGS